MNGKAPIIVSVALALLVALAWRWRGLQERASTRTSDAVAEQVATARAIGGDTVNASTAAAAEPKLMPDLPAGTADKHAQVAKIRRDYEELRTKAAAEYSAAGRNFPGGVAAYLRQLALLEREHRADLATVLTPRELEDFEYAETNAGQLVQRLLRDTGATEEQRRAVFRLQREFELTFAHVYDVSPHANLERETQRQLTQQAIRGVLGDELFSGWLRGEGGDFANFTAFVARQGLPPAKAFELWEAKNAYARQRIELTTQSLSVDQTRAGRQALIQQTISRVTEILGPATAGAQREVLGWLPEK